MVWQLNNEHILKMKHPLSVGPHALLSPSQVKVWFYIIFVLRLSENTHVLVHQGYLLCLCKVRKHLSAGLQ